MLLNLLLFKQMLLNVSFKQIQQMKVPGCLFKELPR